MKRVQVLVAGAFVVVLAGWNLCSGAAVRVREAEPHVEIHEESEIDHMALSDETSTHSIGLDFSSEDTLDFDSEEFQTLLKQLQTHIEGLKANMSDDEQQALSAMEADMKALGDKLNTLRTEAAEFAHTKATYKKEVQDLRAQLAHMEEEKQALHATIEKLEQEAADEDELAHTHEQQVAIDASIAQATEELELKRTEKRGVKAKLQAHEAEIASIEKQMDAQSEFDFGQLFKDMPDEDPSAAFADAVDADEVVAESDDQEEVLDDSAAAEFGDESFEDVSEFEGTASVAAATNDEVVDAEEVSELMEDDTEFVDEIISTDDAVEAE
jgi:DNA repair exonuclease SbcCD ATPase subunit